MLGEFPAKNLLVVFCDEVGKLCEAGDTRRGDTLVCDLLVLDSQLRLSLLVTRCESRVPRIAVENRQLGEEPIHPCLLDADGMRLLPDGSDGRCRDKGLRLLTFLLLDVLLPFLEGFSLLRKEFEFCLKLLLKPLVAEALPGGAELLMQLRDLDLELLDLLFL